MRTLYIHQHLNDLRGATVVKDENGAATYLLVGKWGLQRDVLSLYAIDGALLAEIRQLTLGILPKFSIYQDRQQIGTVGKSLGFLREVIYIRGLNWIVVGNTLKDSYRVYHGTQLVFSLKPVKFTSGYYHELSIVDQELEPVAILIASVLDHWARKGDRRVKKVRQRQHGLMTNPTQNFSRKD
ncbi:hypothetical protein LOOC260_116590 [Paucilactobacillus hokkaidonensis JCM 18461]|uniref:YxjI n=2 Tax=Paucilactobacillus hokkaidonensis TaxID=1193095 RepID=A0A0A1H0F4_9LACO|nr:hypothetical protein [Paucilactobacillus hokkaidonensis]KRO08229.1 hypothetical protein IV59_GL001275 [Paucilactobacillus hokkaidonensis]BAP86166.1 hypothetical protein LOOC260_116590 [Paucilactobacillus hokkaidonensis JCM 18461]